MNDSAVNTKIEGGSVQGVVGAGHVVIENFYLGVARLPAQPPEEVADGEIPPCPYPGLAYFGPQDSALFFGRETAIERLSAAVTHQPLTALVGASGSGKSSVVLAGLAPLLAGRGGWRFSHFRVGTEPDKNPFAALARALVPLLGNGSAVDQLAQSQTLAQHLESGTISIPNALGGCRARNSGKRILLIADQFEEVLTLVPDAERRRRFIDLLLAGFPESAASSEPPDISLILTLRADFYGMALRHRALADGLQGHIENLGPMTREELREAIIRPAGAVSFEEGLVDTLLDDIEMRPGSLPLLQFALREMWARQHGRRITRASYDAIGGIEGALAQRAQAIFSELTDRGENSGQVMLFRRLFTRLITLGEGAEDTRRVVSRDELGAEAWALAQRLAGENNRLVVTSAATPEHETAEVAHEALIRHWPILTDWIDHDRAFQSWLRQLAPRITEWHQHPEDDGTLLRGGALAVAEEWLQRRGDEISDEERAYINASTALRDATRRREKLRHWITAAAAMVFFIVAVIALWSWNAARVQRNQTQLALATIIDTGNTLVLDLREEFAVRRMPDDLLGRMLDPAVRAYTQAIQLDPNNAAVYTNLGAAYETRGEHDKAIEDLNKALQLDPRNAAAYRNRAIAYGNKGDYDRAIMDYDKAIGLNSTLVSAYLGRAGIYETKGEIDRAIENYDKAIQNIKKGDNSARSAFAYIARGNVFSRRATMHEQNKNDHATSIQYYDLAIKDFDQAIAINSEIAVAYSSRALAYELKGDHDQARADSDRAIQLDPAHATEAYEQRGLAYWREGDQDRAIQAFSEAIRINPQDANSFRGRALAYESKHDYERAIQDYSQLIRLDPASAAGTYSSRGLAYERKGDRDQAIRDYSKAIELDPKNVGVHVHRAFAYGRSGDQARAILDFDQAIQLGGNPQEKALAYSGRGDVYRAKGDYDSAIRDYGQVIQIDPKKAAAYNNRGITYVGKNNYDHAIQDFDEAIQLDPKYSQAYNNRGYAYINKRDYDRGIHDYDEAIRLNPDYTVAYRNRGNAYLAKRNYDHAIQDYDQAIRLDPRNLPAYTARGAAHLVTNAYDRAIQDYDQAIQLDQKNSPAYVGRGTGYLVEGDYVRATKDYDLAIQLNPKNVVAYKNRGIANFLQSNFKEAADAMSQANALQADANTMIWRYIARERAGENGAAELETNAAQLKSSDWPRPLIELYLGKRPPERVLSAASTPEERCEARFYDGEWYLLRGNRRAAATALQAAADTCPKNFFEYFAAAVEIKRLPAGASTPSK